MTGAARPLDALAIAVAVGLCFSWGFNSVAIKIALPEIPPFIQSTIRSIVAAAVIGIWALARRIDLNPRDGTLIPGIGAGLLFGFEFLLLYLGLTWTSAARAVIFVNTAPFFVSLGARWLLPGERLSPLQWIGLALSFLGVVVALGGPGSAGPKALWGDLAMLLVAILWAATTLLIKASSLSRAPPEKTLLYQLIFSAPVLALAMLATAERLPGPPSATAWWALAYQTVWVAGITYVLWFALIQRYAASRVSSFTFLTPLFGVAAGHLVLGDEITWPFAVAACLVAAGLVLVNRRR